MTEQNSFTSGNTADTTTETTLQQSFQDGRQPSDDNTGVDTRSPEYQVQVMQKRLDDSQEFINNLKEENQKTREMYASLEERMNNLKSIEEVLNKQDTQDTSNQDTTALDKNALVGDVIKTLHQEQAEKQRQENFEAAKARLTAEFGEHVEEKVTQAAEANGMAYDDMVQMARKSPKAFYKLVGIEGGDNRPTTPSPMRGTSQPPQESTGKDFAYYARLMRENPREYRKPEVQREFRKLFQHNKTN